VFEEYWAKKGNKNNWFYDANTFGYALYADPCTPVPRNEQFRKMVNKRLYCNGQWCDDGKYTCGSHGKTDCYHVEHIVDAGGQEYAACPECKHIAANLVMAWGRWNMGLGGLARHYYADAQAEKATVYGQATVDKVKRLIKWCSQAQLMAFAQSDDLPDSQVNETEQALRGRM
jgi:hypothetical protein